VYTYTQVCVHKSDALSRAQDEAKVGLVGYRDTLAIFIYSRSVHDESENGRVDYEPAAAIRRIAIQRTYQRESKHFRVKRENGSGCGIKGRSIRARRIPPSLCLHVFSLGSSRVTLWLLLRIAIPFKLVARRFSPPREIAPLQSAENHPPPRKCEHSHATRSSRASPIRRHAAIKSRVSHVILTCTSCIPGILTTLHAQCSSQIEFRPPAPSCRSFLDISADQEWTRKHDETTWTLKVEDHQFVQSNGIRPMSLRNAQRKSIPVGHARSLRA